MPHAFVIAVASLTMFSLPAESSNYLVQWPNGTCSVITKDPVGTHHEKHKFFYTRKAAEAAMRKDPACRK